MACIPTHQFYIRSTTCISRCSCRVLRKPGGCTHTRTHTLTHAHIHKHTYAYAYAHAHTHTETDIHTIIHTHRPTDPRTFRPKNPQTHRLVDTDTDRCIHRYRHHKHGHRQIIITIPNIDINISNIQALAHQELIMGMLIAGAGCFTLNKAPRCHTYTGHASTSAHTYTHNKYKRICTCLTQGNIARRSLVQLYVYTYV